MAGWLVTSFGAAGTVNKVGGSGGGGGGAAGNDSGLRPRSAKILDSFLLDDGAEASGAENAVVDYYFANGDGGACMLVLGDMWDLVNTLLP
jgi:hypothetical protein